ncbi:MAG: hypothetical protein SGJ09_18090 [Phycisphaerae bacterium]|nr:hypothetical protein [Phycisphaerae bacterium]
MTSTCCALLFISAATCPPVFNSSVAPDAPNQDERFGFSTDVLGDLMVVGAYGDNVGGSLFRGSASVYERQLGGSWSFTQKLVAPDGAQLDQFGFGVAIAGSRIIVTAPKGPGSQHVDQGCAYVFELSAGTWTNVAKLTLATGANNDAFGYSVSADGDAVAVGAINDDAPTTNQGSVTVFRRQPSGLWTLEQTLVAPGAAANDALGFDVAIKGNDLAAGMSFDDVAGKLDQGSTIIWKKVGATWTFVTQLLAADGAASDFFGTSVALDVDRVLIGSLWDDAGAGAMQGSAYVFERAGGVWSQSAKLVAADSAAGDEVGVATALSGSLAIVGGLKHKSGGFVDAGRAWGWQRGSGGAWTTSWTIDAATPTASENFANVVATDGVTIVIGAYRADTGATDSGRADLFSLPDCPADLNGDGTVDGADLSILLGAWGSASFGDVDCSGGVDGSDLSVLLGSWGSC